MKKIEIVHIFKTRINNELKLYVDYNNTRYILSTLNWEDAKKEAESLLHKFNKNIYID